MVKTEIINYSLRSLFKKKTRSLLTILSIFVGIASIFIFISFGIGLYNYVNEFKTSTSADKLTIMPKTMGAPGLDDSFALTDKDIKAIEKTSGVYEASGVYSAPISVYQGDLRKFVLVQSFDPKVPIVWEISNVDILEGRKLESGDNGKVVLGYNYQFSDKIFPKSYKVGDSIEIENVKVKVVGILESIGNPSDDSQIYMTNDYFKELFPNKTGYALIVAKVDVNDIPNIIKKVEKNIRNSRNLDVGKEDFFVASFQDLLDQYSSALDIVIGFIVAIALVSVVVSTVNTANTMITSVIERTKEIGTMKAVGATNGEILKIFLLESAILGFAGGVVGVTVGFLISYSAGAILENLGWGFLSPAFPIYLFIGLISFATITGALSGIWPAYRASKLKTVEALRYE